MSACESTAALGEDLGPLARQHRVNLTACLPAWITGEYLESRVSGSGNTPAARPLRRTAPTLGTAMGRCPAEHRGCEVTSVGVLALKICLTCGEVVRIIAYVCRAYLAFGRRNPFVSVAGRARLAHE